MVPGSTCLNQAPPASSALYLDIPDAVTDLTVVDNKLQISTATQAKADSTFYCNAKTFVLLMYKRLTLREASESGRLEADGDGYLISAFDQWLKRR